MKERYLLLFGNPIKKGTMNPKIKKLKAPPRALKYARRAEKSWRVSKAPTAQPWMMYVTLRKICGLKGLGSRDLGCAEFMVELRCRSCGTANTSGKKAPEKSMPQFSYRLCCSEHSSPPKTSEPRLKPQKPNHLTGDLHRIGLKP